MTTETILTDAQIIGFLDENRLEYDFLDKAIAVSRAIEKAVLQSPEVQALTEWKEWPLEMPPLTSAPVLAFNRHTKGAEIVYGWLLDEVDDYSHWIPLPPPPTK